MRLAPTLLLPALALLPLGCSREVQATKDDIQASIGQAADERERLTYEIRRYAIDNGRDTYRLKADAEDLLAERRRAWWALEREAAWQITDEWQQIERLSTDAARFYGYEVHNFPRAGRQALDFMRDADESWRRLVQDCGTYLEWRNREAAPLSRQLKDFYRQAGWEAANGIADVRDFLAWRQREYRRLAAQIRRTAEYAFDEWERLSRDIDNFRSRASTEGHLLISDFSRFGHEEVAMVPRFLDDVDAMLAANNGQSLGQYMRASAESALIEAHRLLRDLEQFQRQESLRVALLRAQVDDFFRVYEREVRPLDDEIKRFWRDEIGKGHLVINDLKRFLAHTADECWGLERDIRTFIVDGKGEWQNLRARIREFIHFDKAAFGDGTRRISNVSSRPVFGDYAFPPGFEP